MRHVYCVEALDERVAAYKIGVASCVNTRIAQLQSSNYALLNQVISFPCYDERNIEALLHSALGQFNIRGEWFQPHQFVREAVLRCADIFLALTEDQNELLCRTAKTDGWLYRRIKGRESEKLPVWLRLYA